MNSVFLGRMLARGVRGASYAALRFERDRPARPQRELDLTVYSFAGTRQVLDLLASARSFLDNVGRPRRFVVVSDGTLNRYDVPRIERLDESLSVTTIGDLLDRVLPTGLLHFGVVNPSGRKLAMLVSLPPQGPAIYTDSDILFFPGAADEIQALAAPGGPPHYMVDSQVAFDERALTPEELRAPPLNSGFLVLPAPLDWDEALRRLQNLGGEPFFHTEQTIVHVAVQQAGGRPLPTDRYVLQSDDATSLREPLVRSGVVLRHYTAPVRHKLWLRVARQKVSPRRVVSSMWRS